MTTPCIHQVKIFSALCSPALYLTKLVSNTTAIFTVALAHLQIFLKIFESWPEDIILESVTIVIISLKNFLSFSNMHNILLKNVLKPLHFILFLYLTPSVPITLLITLLSLIRRAQVHPFPSKYFHSRPVYCKNEDPVTNNLYLLRPHQNNKPLCPKTDQKPHHQDSITITLYPLLSFIQLSTTP